jgi:FkbM family methyltransferase
MSTIKRYLQTAFRSLGFEARGLQKTLAWQRQRLLAESRLPVVLDVGANLGQYSRELRARGFQGEIISFEPNQRLQERLVKLAAADGNMRCVIAALGSEPGTAPLCVAEQHAASSLHPPNETLRAKFPSTQTKETQAVTVLRLDDWIVEHCPKEQRFYLKLDVQGFEDQVLQGATRILHRIDAIETELSLVPLYCGQASWLEIVRLLASHGFHAVWLEPNLFDPTNGNQLQIDGLFLRTFSTRNAQYTESLQVA